MTDTAPKTLVDAIRRWARERPAATAFRFLTQFGERVEELTFEQLDREAASVAARILEVAKPGDTASLIFTSEAAFIRAFFGSLYAGVLAVPAPPPSLHRGGGRLGSLVADCRPAIILTHTEIVDVLRRRFETEGGSASLAWLAVDTATGETATARELPPPPEGGDAALIQYTSGSTATPRGVVVTHGNLVANCLATQANGVEMPSLRSLSWLPLFHDMGLVGQVVVPAYFGATATLMPAYDFLQKPVSWLRAMSDYRATYSLAPNFAYDLCVDRAPEGCEAEIDLSRWFYAGNGSEPARHATMKRFAARFGACGFDVAHFFPLYGLAEATLFVSGGPREIPYGVCRANREALFANRVEEVEDGAGTPSIEVVGNGFVRPDTTLKIVDPDSREELPPAKVGEIWLRGPSVAKGYWERPDESRETFEAICASDGERYLRTGDLGFFRERQLFICGRIKDLVIVNGRNHHAADLELAVEGCHPALAKGGAVVFSVDEGVRERPIAVCEVRRSAPKDPDVKEMAAAVRAALAERHGLALDDVAIVRHGSLPKTTSGKMMRSACRMMYLQGRLERIGGEK
jgi:acyl-CoA synthetase (AMP-forming)/AMP-acid ligase II